MVNIVESIATGVLGAMLIDNLTAGDLLQEPIPVPEQSLVKISSNETLEQVQLTCTRAGQGGQQWRSLP